MLRVRNLIMPREILALLSCFLQTSHGHPQFNRRTDEKMNQVFSKIAVRQNLCFMKEFYYNCVRFPFNRFLAE